MKPSHLPLSSANCAGESARRARRSADATWAELTRAARQLSSAEFSANCGPEAAPYGFATRVAARALAQRRSSPSLLETLSLRALGLAGLTMALALAAHFFVPQSVAAADEELFFAVEDPSAIILGEGGGAYE
ncbi:hypothetical protein AXK11_03715 [Cephaloticoccus primus]|uniref:Uncharacterized protein n=1 Tax=Cephaloticoccus primus TaxID=1548207 RepID=A0A139SQ24_9BACT|nr:hypothetical protein [Cephaloticoccus primus]KXU36648.1 hypothetical protein AXK11_03715 [Cephaloticoccus primus]